MLISHIFYMAAQPIFAESWLICFYTLFLLIHGHKLLIQVLMKICIFQTLRTLVGEEIFPDEVISRTIPQDIPLVTIQQKLDNFQNHFFSLCISSSRRHLVQPFHQLLKRCICSSHRTVPQTFSSNYGQQTSEAQQASQIHYLLMLCFYNPKQSVLLEEQKSVSILLPAKTDLCLG